MAVSIQRFDMARDHEEFATRVALVDAVVDTSARLPDLPFVARAGSLVVGEYTRLLGTDIVPVLQALVHDHLDDFIIGVVTDPAPSYYSKHYGFLPAFTVPSDALGDGYWDALNYSPSGDPTGELGVSANVAVIVGSSRQWAVWGERAWELFLVWAAEPGAWMSADVPFEPVRTALVDFAGHGSWGTRLDDGQVAEFIRNVETFG